MSDNYEARLHSSARAMVATATSIDALLDEIVTALRREDLARATHLLASNPGAIPDATLLRLADLNMRRRRWGDAALLFDQLQSIDSSNHLKRCLCRNLASLQRHRPDVYETVVALPAGSDVTIGAAADGRPTIVCRRGDGSTIGLSPGNDPLLAMKESMARLRPTLDRGAAIAICGMGDGYVVHALAQDTTPLFLGMQQPVFIIEPDPRVALNCLMIHDYTGPQGPIEQRRFWWIVGAEWMDDLQRLMSDDPFTGVPSMMLGLSLQSGVIHERLNEIVQASRAADTATAELVEKYYGSVERESLAALFGPRPPRKPRVLLLTTRFSTVLQYSTRDTADAFAELGWDAQVLIEPSPAHRLYQFAMRRTLDQFKPDLVFQIDHLRHEHGGMFPRNLPFACWVQDHLPNLQNRVAGLAVGKRDFVLTDMGPTYAARHGYPLRQCIALPKLTRVPKALPEIAPQQSSGDDLVFVSNASHVPEKLVERLLTTIEAPPEILRLVERCAREIIAIYNAGGSLPVFADVRNLVVQMQEEAGLRLPAPELRNLAAALTHPLNDALYRQQGLAWAAEAARELGLTLALYGNGWDEHPVFAEHARGPVQYGVALEELTRNSRINLQIVPFSCLHQRLLDGLIAGGFFLIRENPTDTSQRELLDLLQAYAPPDACSVEAARAGLPIGQRERFDRLIVSAREFLCAGDGEDPVACLLAWRDAGMLVAGADVLPHYSDVRFGDAASLRRRIEQYVNAPHDRAEIIQAQRCSVVARFGYAAGMRRVVAGIGDRLARHSDEKLPVVVHQWRPEAA